MWDYRHAYLHPVNATCSCPQIDTTMQRSLTPGLNYRRIYPSWSKTSLRCNTVAGVSVTYVVQEEP